MNSLVYNGNRIDQRADGYVNGTQMAKANHTLVGNWLRLQSTTAYMEELSSVMQICITDLVVVIQGGSDQCTWFHPLAAIAFAQWISPKFHVWCNMHIKTLIETGSAHIEKPPTSNQSVSLDVYFLVLGDVLKAMIEITIERKVLFALRSVIVRYPEYAHIFECMTFALGKNGGCPGCFVATIAGTYQFFDLLAEQANATARNFEILSVLGKLAELMFDLCAADVAKLGIEGFAATKKDTFDFLCHNFSDSISA